MSTKWYAINYDTMTYFRAPDTFGYNKGYHVHNPTNIFPNLFIYMNEKDDGMETIYELKNDINHDLLKGGKWTDFKDITEDVHKEYLEFWNRILEGTLL